jgi:hypothetical protein
MKGAYIGLQVMLLGVAAILITWDCEDSLSVDTYQVYRSEASNFSDPERIGDVVTRYLIDSSYAVGERVYYRVKARRAGLDSDYSNQVSALYLKIPEGAGVRRGVRVSYDPWGSDAGLFLDLPCPELWITSWKFRRDELESVIFYLEFDPDFDGWITLSDFGILAEDLAVSPDKFQLFCEMFGKSAYREWIEGWGWVE